jgi:hypothetical protein
MAIKIHSENNSWGKITLTFGVKSPALAVAMALSFLVLMYFFLPWFVMKALLFSLANSVKQNR